MAVQFDYEIFEMFKEQFFNQLPVIEQNILMLDKPDEYKDATDNLFRYIHNYKATSNYLGLDSIYILVCKTESVLTILRESEHAIEESIIEWLLKVKDQMEVWADEMELGLKTFTEVDKTFLNQINLTKESRKPSEIIKGMSLLYIDSNSARAEKIVAALSKLLKEVVFISDITTLDNSISKSSIFEIAIINCGNDNYKIIDILHNKMHSISIISVFDKLNSSTLLKLGIKGISNSLSNPIKGPELKRELLNIAHTYHSQRRVLIDNKKIFNFISDLQPLPNTLLQIQQVCDDDDMGVKELIQVVKMDAVITGTLLNAASKPIYGLKSVSTIDSAVKAFGKRTVKAVAMSQLSEYMGEVDLRPYHINEETFSLVSSLRLSLMVAWYSKVSISSLSVLSTTAILGNLGQLLISKEILSVQKDSYFYQEIQNSNIQLAEEKYLHTTTAFVSSDILNYWQLSDEIVDSIRYSDNPIEAPLEIRSLAVANHILYNIVKLDGTFLEEIPDEIYYMMSEEGLDTTLLTSAIQAVRSNIK